MLPEILIVNVFYRGEDVPLEVDPSHRDLRPGCAIVWQFHGVPSGCRASIQFGPESLNTTATEPVGPFHYLKHLASVVTGFGNSGLAGEYPYTALVLNDQVVLATSASARIDNHSSVAEEIEDAFGFFAEEDGKRVVVVMPPILQIHSGGTIVWFIEEVPTDCSVEFSFTDFPDPEQGLFSSFSVHQEGTSRVATGTGFSDQFPIGAKIKYCVTVTRPQGSWTVRHDPVIESLGPPPGTNS